MKPWYKSKTIWFNILVAGLAALEGGFSMLQPMLPVNTYAILSTILVVGNAMLRVISVSKLTK